MSAILLWCAIVIGTQVEAGFITRNGPGVMTTVENTTGIGNELFVYNPNRKIVVEEVDKHGKSVVKELELPDYDENDEMQDDRKRIEEQQQQKKKKRKKKEQEEEEKHRSEKSTEGKKGDLYGCDNRRENQRRKCLQRQKKFLKTRYRSWKTVIRRILKDLEGKIKTIGHDSRRQSTKENLNFMSGFSPKNVMRKKE